MGETVEPDQSELCNGRLKIARLCLAAILICAAVNSSTAQTKPPSAADFFAQPLVASPSMSPDGKYVAFTVRDDVNRYKLVVNEIGTDAFEAVAQSGNASVVAPHWVNNSRLVFSMQRNGVEFGMYAVDKDGKNLKQLVRLLGHRTVNENQDLLPFGSRYASSITDKPSDEIFAWRAEREIAQGAKSYTLGRLDTRSGAFQAVPQPASAVEESYDSAGNLWLKWDRTRKDKHAFNVRDKSGQFFPLYEYDPRQYEKRIGNYCVFDRNVHFLSLFGNGDRREWVRKTVSDSGVKSEVVHRDDTFDVAPTSRFLQGFYYFGSSLKAVWFDEELATIQQKLDRASPKSNNKIIQISSGKPRRVLVEMKSDAISPTFTVFDGGSNRLFDLGGNTMPKLIESALPESDFKWVASRDGLRIPSLLTLPSGSNGKNLPALVWLQTFPSWRTAYRDWNPTIQFVVSRGYAVVTLDVRGTPGYGLAYVRAGNGEFGKGMQGDIEDVLKHYIDEGTLDPKRICIGGMRLGGTMAMMSLIQSPHMFRCGVTFQPDTDLEAGLVTETFDGDGVHPTGNSTFYGQLLENSDTLKHISPLKHASSLKQPLLMEFNSLDKLHKVHGEPMRKALAHNDNVAWVLDQNITRHYTGPMGSIVIRPQQEFWERAEAFLAKHNR